MKKLWRIFSKGILSENPIFVLALSLCPALAVTTTAVNALTMGLSVTFVLSANNVSISLTRKIVNPKVRAPIYIVSIATIVTVVDLILSAYLPAFHKELGVYLQLIVVFAIILARAEVFASKNSVLHSFLDGFGMGAGFTLAMLVIGIIRELIGNGSIFGHIVLNGSYQPALIMILPPGAFILIGYLVGASKILNDYFEKKEKNKGRIA